MNGSRPTLDQLLVQRTREAPDRPFLLTRQATYTFAEFDAASGRLAGGLVGLGLAAGDMVAVMLRNGPEFMLTWFAIARAGAVEVPINTAFRSEGLAHTLNLTRCKFAVVDESFLPSLIAVWDTLDPKPKVIVRGSAPDRFLSFEAVAAGEPLVDRHSGSPHEMAMLLFTSGTTGRSKACVISNNFLVQQGEQAVRVLGLKATDVLYCPFPLFHADATMYTVLPALLLGAPAAIAERFSVSGFWADIKHFRATVFDFMGATLALTWKQPPSPADTDHPARLAWGLPMPEWAPEFERRFGVRLVTGFGMTDAGIVLGFEPDEPWRPGSCGRPLHPYDVRVFDDGDSELPPGQVGEIVIRPLEPGVMMDGYFGMPEATLAAMRNLWFHTGDLARRDAEGYFYFAGRKKDSIRRRGENISAVEIEDVVNGHPQVLETAAFGVPSELTEEEVKVCVVLRPGSRLSPKQLLDYCEARMAKFMLPRYVEFVPSLPKTPTEKVEKFRLVERWNTAQTWDRGS